MLRNPKALLVGFMGLFGGLPSIKEDSQLPSVDDIVKKYAQKAPVQRYHQRMVKTYGYTLRKHKRQIAHASRMKNLLRNGTRG